MWDGPLLQRTDRIGMAATEEAWQTVKKRKEVTRNRSREYFLYRIAQLVGPSGHAKKWFLCNTCGDVKCDTVETMKVQIV